MIWNSTGLGSRNGGRRRIGPLSINAGAGGGRQQFPKQLQDGLNAVFGLAGGVGTVESDVDLAALLAQRTRGPAWRKFRPRRMSLCFSQFDSAIGHPWSKKIDDAVRTLGTLTAE